MDFPMINDMIEEKDGEYWIACSSTTPYVDKTVILEGLKCRVYHPDAKVINTSLDGSDDEYECTHCKKSWWVEYDG